MLWTAGASTCLILQQSRDMCPGLPQVQHTSLVALPLPPLFSLPPPLPLPSFPPGLPPLPFPFCRSSLPFDLLLPSLVFPFPFLPSPLMRSISMGIGPLGSVVFVIGLIPENVRAPDSFHLVVAVSKAMIASLILPYELPSFKVRFK